MSFGELPPTFFLRPNYSKTLIAGCGLYLTRAASIAARRPFLEFLEQGNQLGLAELQADALHVCMMDDVGCLVSP